MVKSTPFSRHVYAVQHYVRHTAARYESLMQPGIITHPICCFGNVETAEVVTVGVNPSWGEFKDRCWPSEFEHFEMSERCRTYFEEGAAGKPHPWFTPWMKALDHLGYNYGNGSAVHLDLTPRATRYVSALDDH